MRGQLLSRAGNAAVIGILLAGTAWLGKTMQHNYLEHATPPPSEVRVAPAELPVAEGDARGEALLLGRDTASLLFVLSTTCAYCEQNMDEWRRVVALVERLGEAAPEVMVLSVSPAEDTARFLAEHDLRLPVRIVDPAVLPLLGLRGYPSTVAVDARTRSLAVWEGVLEDAEHAALGAWSRSALAANGSVEAAGGPPAP